MERREGGRMCGGDGCVSVLRHSIAPLFVSYEALCI